MDTNPFRTVRRYLGFAPVSKWGAILATGAASLILLPLLPLLYLFADLLATGGLVPAYQSLPAARQQEFRVTQGGDGSGPTGPEGWDAQWQSDTRAWLAENVSSEAADLYQPAADAGKNWPAGRVPLGILATAARERGRWAAAPLAPLARAVPALWRPDGDRPANGVYLSALFAVGFAILLVRGLLLLAAGRTTAACTVEAVTRLRRTLYTHSYRLSAVTVRPDAQAEAGDLVTTRAEHLHDGFAAWLTGLRGPVLVGVGLVVLVTVGPALAAAVLLLGGLVWLVAGQAAAWFRQDTRRAARRTESRLALLREGLAVMPLIKGYQMERFSQTRVERHLADLGRAAWRRQRGDAISRTALLAVASLAGVLMLYLAGWVVLGGGLSAAGVVEAAAALITLVVGLSRWVSARARIGRARSAAAEVVEFLDRRGEAGQRVDAEFLQPLNRRLDFVEVSLREPGTGRMVLENVSLSVPAGSRAAVVFADPAEAHALAHLIARFEDPTAGEVRVDGKNVRWVTLESLRAQVGLVLEQCLVFADTAANNIGCGDASYTLPQIIEAAKRAHAHQFVQSLPYGYETQIGHGGASLSVGQQFRVALARALLRDPSLLIIEEPGGGMDADSLALVDDTLAQLPPGRTILFLARRPATVKAADRVFVLQGGKLAAAGRHDELVAGNELYRLLHFRQSLSTADAG